MSRQGRARLTWAGFALFGWVYLGTTFGPWADVHGVHAPPYLTRWPLDYWDAKLWSAGRIETALPGEMLFPRGSVLVLPPRGSVLVLPPDAFQFRRAGHCLAALLFSLVGAVSGRLLAVKDERPSP
jgi:hypothetical protein